MSMTDWLKSSRINSSLRLPGSTSLNYNAIATAENSLAEAKDEKGMKRVEKFLKQETCPDCSGTWLMDLGLGYLTLDRAGSTLSTGERQRMQMVWAVRNRDTGVLYVLDEPSIGLHPTNIVGLNAACTTWWRTEIPHCWSITTHRSSSRPIG